MKRLEENLSYLGSGSVAGAEALVRLAVAGVEIGFDPEAMGGGDDPLIDYFGKIETAGADQVNKFLQWADEQEQIGTRQVNVKGVNIPLVAYRARLEEIRNQSLLQGVRIDAPRTNFQERIELAKSDQKRLSLEKGRNEQKEKIFLASKLKQENETKEGLLAAIGLHDFFKDMRQGLLEIVNFPLVVSRGPGEISICRDYKPHGDDVYREDLLIRARVDIPPRKPSIYYDGYGFVKTNFPLEPVILLLTNGQPHLFDRGGEYFDLPFEIPLKKNVLELVQDKVVDAVLQKKLVYKVRQRWEERPSYNGGYDSSDEGPG